jgi:LmbE family N-acetylglucosaminyl deacetylase
MVKLFNEIKIMENSKILVLAPHPDDFDAIAVTLKLFRDNGNHIELAVISGAESGVEDCYCENCPGMTKAEIREGEQLASCRFFGLPESQVSFLRLNEDENGDPMESESNLKILNKYISRVKPDIVFMPHWNDTNPGHQRTYSMFKKSMKGVTVYLNRDPKTIEMRPDIYTLFDEKGANWKAELLRHHKSQHQRNLNTRGYGFDERVLRVNRQIAQESGSTASYAEVFEIEKI